MMRGGQGGSTWHMLRERGNAFPVVTDGMSVRRPILQPPVRLRPALTSKLPPTGGPQNQNKYRDRDNNAQAVDGLDYDAGAGGFEGV